MKKRAMLSAVLLSSSAIAGAPREVSAIYPGLAMFNGERECGTGAVVPWAVSLWVVTYAPHAPYGSSDRIYEISPDLRQIVREESVGGTPGKGGPWMQTQVPAAVPSDPFLMTGFDRKRLDLSNGGDGEATFTLEADVTGDGHWAVVKKFHLKPGESLQHTFPTWFQACWVRLISSNGTVATAQFTYD